MNGAPGVYMARHWIERCRIQVRCCSICANMLQWASWQINVALKWLLGPPEKLLAGPSAAYLLHPKVALRPVLDSMPFKKEAAFIILCTFQQVTPAHRSQFQALQHQLLQAEPGYPGKCSRMQYIECVNNLILTLLSVIATACQPWQCQINSSEEQKKCTEEGITTMSFTPNRSCVSCSDQT